MPVAPSADPSSAAPFADFAPPVRPQTPLRAAITAATRRPEPECLAPLIEAATLPAEQAASVRATARHLVESLRNRPGGSGIDALVHEYKLSSQEGVALMCLAEALLRIPDTATRDALIRDKIGTGNWAAHLGEGRSLFVNAATWGLVVTGRLTATVNDSSLSAALTRLVARCGEPVIRAGVDMAMRMMGEKFVTGETIAEALERSQPMERKGFRYSYDMLGEAAATAADADRYFRDYDNAIHAIGSASAGRGIIQGPGISIKLSALHPRYSRAQADRVMGELLPRVKTLAVLAKGYDIGFNIDAEEADRLEISLDLLESLALDPDLAGWNGLGFVVQAYGRRCPFVLDFIIDLARRANRRIMVRLVKGAYWDAEIKRAQLDGLSDYPVYTRKVYTDVSYIACARKLLGARDAVFPQFATHNAQTAASIYALAGPDYAPEDYEFQCLHGMGEPLYEEVVSAAGLARPCRVYAPVGTHETLLAYLVRRLLENGANSSFVNRIADPAVPVDALIADPAAEVSAMPVPGARHPAIALPGGILGGGRVNSAGLDLASETVLADLSTAFAETARRDWQAGPILADGAADGPSQPVRNPADNADVVGSVSEASADDVRRAAARAAAFAAEWAATPVEARAAALERAADLMQARIATFMGLAIREAGKSAANAIAEVREAIDFLRYYAIEARRTLGEGRRPLGPVTCISPWNFPLAIFTGQVAAALAAGNPVLAKPAEETPLIAAEAVRLLHAAGVPAAALQLLPGDGKVGAALVAAPETMGVMFTGSTEVARLIQAELAKRVSPAGRPIPLIAETGGQNAMIVDSSALAEQVVADVLASAFDSAGQRCSALRILCLQEDVAERVLAMLKGAMAELSVGRPDRIATDIGPVITAEAQGIITAHVERMRARGRRVHQMPLPAEAADGTFVPPTLIELDGIADLEREVFGPVLHVVRYRRDDLNRLIDAINATGYGLTFGLHTRLDATIARVTERVRVGNIYVNRNVIGAVVGVQPFGGRGLSGTGPKAGGPLYLGRLVQNPPAIEGGSSDPAAALFAGWLRRRGSAALADQAQAIAGRAALGLERELSGPVGERNLYALHPRGRILLLPETGEGLAVLLAAVLATGNRALIAAAPDLRAGLADLPETLAARIDWADGAAANALCAGALVEGEGASVLKAMERVAARPGPLLLTQSAPTAALVARADALCLDWLVEEVSTSINTTAAGGNASLMALD